MSSDIKEAKKVYFRDKASVKRGRLENTGIPFVSLGLKRFDCQFGKNRKKNKKHKECEDDHERYRKGKKFLLTTSKKLGCPASCVIREICRFPTYKTTEEQTQAEKAFISEDLLMRIWEGQDIPFERVFIVCLPCQSDHQGHRFGDLMPEPIDGTLSKTIKDLVKDGINAPGLVRNHLNQYVKNNISPRPHPCNRRFHPSLKTIRNIIYTASTDKIVDDQTNLRDWIHNTKFRTEDFVFCRLKVEQEEDISDLLQYGSKFLFAYQSKEQRHLLERYGSTVFLDATYKTTAYDLSLFFMVVKTNIDYQVVGAFVVEDEQSDSIIDALTTMRVHCFTRIPSFFMTDFNEAEIHALETVFPETRVVLCNFHRNQAWERWSSKKENSLNNKTEILKWLYTLANCFNEEDFSSALERMAQSITWKNNKRFQQYFNKIWLPNRKRWSRAYRRGEIELVAGTNNGIEIQHRIFKTNYLHKNTNKSFVGMIKILVEDFFPNRYLGYREGNAKCSGEFGVFNPDIPTALHRRPRKFIKHCLEEIDASKDIEKLDREVSLGDENSFPVCNCLVWEQTSMPCRHMFFLMLEDRVLNWTKLSSLYMASVYSTIDDSLEQENEHNNATPLVIEDSLEHENTKIHPTFPVKDDSIEDPQIDTPSPVIYYPKQEDALPNITVPSKRGLPRKIRESLSELTRMTYIVTDYMQLQSIYDTIHGLLVQVQKSVGQNESGIPYNRKFISLTKRKGLSKRKKKLAKKGLEKNVQVKESVEATVSVHAEDYYKGKETVSLSQECNIPVNEECVQVPPHLPSDSVPESNVELCNEVRMIWKAAEIDRHIGMIGPYQITHQSIKCVQSYLSDEVIDGFMHILVSNYDQPNSKIFHMNCIGMTAIFERQRDIHHCMRGVSGFMTYNIIIGAFNEGGNHWCLIIILPQLRRILYLNPLGTKHVLEQNIVLNWYKFLQCRYEVGLETSLPDAWELSIPPHAKQHDGSSCGLYVLKFAENYLTDKPLFFNWDEKDVQTARYSLATFLLTNTTSAQRSNQPEGQNEEMPHLQMEIRSPIPLRKERKRKRKSNFVYYTTSKRRRVFCICRKPNDGRTYWQCEMCCKWFHPACVGQKEDQEPEVYFCSSCKDSRKEETESENITDQTECDEDNRSDKQDIDLSYIKEIFTEVKTYICQILTCMNDKCDKSNHERHHSFIRNYASYLKKSRRKYMYGIKYFSVEIHEQITNKLTEEFIYFIQDSKNPVTGLKISLIKHLPMDCSLYRILSKGKMLAHHYLLHVLVKEVMAFLLSSRFSISTDKAEEICKATEIEKPK